MHQKNKPIIKYNLTNKKIFQINFDNKLTKKTESIFCQGNGYLGLRAVDEELDFYNKEDFFVNGFFNKDSENEVPELVNLTDTLKTKIIIDNQVINLQKVLKYKKTLHLKTGLLERTFSLKIKNKLFEFQFLRLVDQVKLNFYTQKIIIKQIKGEPSIIEIYPTIDGQVTNFGSQHFSEGIKKSVTENAIQYNQKTTFSKLLAIHQMIVNAYVNNEIISSKNNDNFVLQMARRQVGFKIKSEIKTNQTFVLEKNMAITTSIDDPNKIMNDQEVITKAVQDFKQLKQVNFNKVLKTNKQEYQKIYNQFFVNIKGKNRDAKYDAFAFMFSIYHLNNFISKFNPNVSVGAKGLSGEGYQGHCYWDTEFFIIPNYTLTQPQIARNLLEYRYKGIEGARNKAKESNLKGAQYPWEAARPTDGEVTPYWGQPDLKTGKQVPIASRQQEIHVSGDVAFCVDQYFQITKDHKFMEEMGYEMIIDTAIFWSERAEPYKNKYIITNVMGPNEYKGNIDNNNFINLIAKKNLELAIKYIDYLNNSTLKNKELLQKINQRIPYSYSVAKLKKVKNNLVLQQPNKDLIIAENDQFLKLPKANVKPFQFLGDAGKKLFNTIKGQELLSTQLCKQADVVLSLFIFEELFDPKVIEANLNYYSEITTHDSSLSASTYMIVANDLKQDVAYDLFKYAINIDMGTNFHSSDAGIHAGSLSAIWQMIVFGFGGFRFINNKVRFNPKLPKTWTGLDYSVLVWGSKILVQVKQNQFKIKVIQGNDLECWIANKKVILTKKFQTFPVLK